MSRNQQIAIAKIVFGLQERGSYEWSDVAREVNAAALKIKNWLAVRAVMQAANDQEGFGRDGDVFAERFVRI